jgi:hypothetical protein
MVIIVQVYVWGINSNYNLGLGHNSTRNNPELVEQFREAGQLCAIAQYRNLIFVF